MARLRGLAPEAVAAALAEVSERVQLRGELLCVRALADTPNLAEVFLSLT